MSRGECKRREGLRRVWKRKRKSCEEGEGSCGEVRVQCGRGGWKSIERNKGKDVKKKKRGVERSG